MGSCLRRFLAYGSAAVYDSLRLLACTDERGTDDVAILSPALSPYPATVFHIHDTIQHPANVMGTAGRGNIHQGFITNIPEFPYAGRTFLVYVSSD